MTWSMTHPVLFCLPAILCLVVHVILCAGFLLDARKGFYRFFIFMAGALFVVVYLLLFNQSYTQATTRVSIHQAGGYLYLSNHYGALQIPQEAVRAVLVEGEVTRPRVVWVYSDRQVFYLDARYGGLETFLPALQKIVALEDPVEQSEGKILWASAVTDRKELVYQREQNTLKGNTFFYLPWLVIAPLFFYLLGQQAWLGKYKYFYVLLFLYGLPLTVLGCFFKPALPLAFFLVLYPLVLLFFSAMCIRESPSA